MNNIDRIAYLNTLGTKRPFDLLLEIIEIDCYKYDFNELGVYTTDAKSIMTILDENYRIHIEEYALKKWVSIYFELECKKLKLKQTADNLCEKITRITCGERNFLEKVSDTRALFVKYTQDNFDIKINHEQAKKIFNEYIYTVSTNKLVNYSRNESKYFFIFQTFLKKLYKEDRNTLALIENFGIANQIQSLVINSDENDMLFLKGCTIYLDTPILMRRLGYDGLELSVNYTKFIDDLIQAGAEIKIFEHTLEEMWSILFNFKRCIAQNIFDGKGVMTFLNARREFLDGNGKEVLSLDKGEVEENIKNLGIDIIDITDEDNREEKSDLKNGKENYELLKEKLIEADNSYQKYEARLNNDFQSIISIFRLRQKFGIKFPKKLKDGKYFFLVDNYALVLALRNYYREINEQSYKNELLLENQIVFELWQNLSGKDTLNRALFRSKCFALNTIDEEFKEALYRETRKIEIYSPEIEINHQLVSNPYLENELFAESIKSDRIDDEYLSKTLLNKIEEDKKREEQRHKQELQKKDEEINAKEMEKTQIKNEAQNKYNEQEDALALQKIKSKKDTENALRDYKISLIQKKVEEISSKPMYKLVTLFLGLKREFNREKYLWSKACEIVGETIDFPEHG